MTATGEVTAPQTATGRSWLRLVAIGGIVVYLVRGIERLSAPRMFAEDGQVFLSDAWNLGWGALFKSSAGYLHLIPRLIAELLSVLPLTAMPLAYAVVAVGLYLATASLVLSARVSWLLPSRRLRAAAFLLLVLLPVMDEVYGNIANLVAVSGLALFLLALGVDPVSRLRRAAELITVTLAGLTGPYSAFTWPLFWWRWQREGRSRHGLLVALLVTACGALQGLVVALSSRNSRGGTAHLFVPVLVERFAGGWLFGPVPVFSTSVGPVAVSLAVAWLTLAVAVTVLRLGREGFWLWGYAVGLLVVACQMYGGELLLGPAADQRQLLVPMAVVAVALVATTARVRRRGEALVVTVCLVAGTGGWVAGLVPGQYPLDSDMSGLASCVRAGETPCRTVIFAPGWSITLR